MKGSFILASASPRREQLLRGMGLEFRVIPSDVDENFLEGEQPRNHVIRLSRDKSSAVAVEHRDSWVLGADTIVIINGDVLGKPETQEDAREMLRKLSGREHRVITGFTLIHRSTRSIFSDAVESVVVFKEIQEDEMNWYVNSREPYDKAGAYAVQGMAAYFVREIRGSYSNVVGLPLTEVVTALKDVGAVTF
jgi:septum formation protein